MSHPGTVKRLGIRTRLPGPQNEIATTVSLRLIREMLRRTIKMQKHLFAMIIGLGLAASIIYLFTANLAVAAGAEQSSATFESDGKLKLIDPSTFRRWV